MSQSDEAPEPRTELGRLILDARRKMTEAGIPFLTDEEIDHMACEERGFCDCG